ncbi:unnamed protein product [Symbiodinium sp. CCMP2456]|nr:unnamed protein product [Symbiodinium sp. CCMP2456]
MAEDEHAMSVAIVLKSPRVGGKFEVPTDCEGEDASREGDLAEEPTLVPELHATEALAKKQRLLLDKAYRLADQGFGPLELASLDLDESTAMAHQLATELNLPFGDWLVDALYCWLQEAREEAKVYKRAQGYYSDDLAWMSLMPPMELPDAKGVGPPLRERNRKLIEDGCSVQAREERLLDIWCRKLRDELQLINAPVLVSIQGSLDPDRAALLLTGSTRASMLKRYLGYYRQWRLWLGEAKLRLPPGRPSDLVDYLLARRDEPCGRWVPEAILKAIAWVEKVAEFEEMLRATHGRLAWAAKDKITEILSEGARLIKRAPRHPVFMLMLLAAVVIDVGHAIGWKIWAWAKLIKVWASLRVGPASYHPRRALASGGEAFHRAKANQDIGSNWLKVGFDLLRTHANYKRDYLLPRLNQDGLLEKKPASYADAMVATAGLLGILGYRWKCRVPPQDKDLLGRVARLQALFAKVARGANRYDRLDEREIAADLVPWLMERGPPLDDPAAEVKVLDRVARYVIVELPGGSLANSGDESGERNSPATASGLLLNAAAQFGVRRLELKDLCLSFVLLQDRYLTLGERDLLARLDNAKVAMVHNQALRASSWHDFNQAEIDTMTEAEYQAALAQERLEELRRASAIKLEEAQRAIAMEQEAEVRSYEEEIQDASDPAARGYDDIAISWTELFKDANRYMRPLRGALQDDGRQLATATDCRGAEWAVEFFGRARPPLQARCNAFPQGGNRALKANQIWLAREVEELREITEEATGYCKRDGPLGEAGRYMSTVTCYMQSCPVARKKGSARMRVGRGTGTRKQDALAKKLALGGSAAGVVVAWKTATLRVERQAEAEATNEVRELIEKKLAELESGEFRAEPLTEIISRDEVDPDTLMPDWDAKGTLSTLKKGGSKTAMPSGPEQLRLRLTVLQNALIMIQLRQLGREELKDVNMALFEKYKEYLLGDYCYGLRSSEDSGSLVPPWTLVLQYEHAIRKHAYKVMATAGYTFGAALTHAYKEPSVKEHNFTTPLALHAKRPQPWIATADRPPKKLKNGKGKGKGKDGKGAKKLKEGSDRTPEGNPICFRYNGKGGCKQGAKCHFARFCMLCFGKHPATHCPQKAAPAKVLYLFSGVAHKLDMATCLQQLGPQQLLGPHPRKGVDAILLSPRCASFSRATWANFRGPRPVRSYELPRGLEKLTPAERDRAILKNIFADFSFQVATLVADGAAGAARGPWSAIHWTARGAPARLYVAVAAASRPSGKGTKDCGFSPSSFGVPYAKPTRLLLRASLDMPDFVYEGLPSYDDQGYYKGGLTLGAMPTEQPEKEAFKMAAGGEQGCSLASDPEAQAPGDPDRELLRQAEEGLPVGVLDPLPRTPRVFEKQLKWPLENAPWEASLAWVPNYSSVAESLRPSSRGHRRGAIMTKMSLKDFLDHYGVHTAIAALAVIVEDEAKDKKRVIHDATHGVRVNHRIKEKKHLLREHEEAGEVAFSVVGDIAKAHRRFKHAAKEHGYLACQVDAEEETVYVNFVGTFGLSCASYWWTRIAACGLRLTYHLLGPGFPLDMLLYADDLESMGRGAKGRRGIPLSYLYLAALGLSLKRATWLVEWLGGLAESGKAQAKSFVQGLGQIRLHCARLGEALLGSAGPLRYRGSRALSRYRPWSGSSAALAERLESGGRLQKPEPLLEGAAPLSFFTDAKGEEGRVWVGGFLGLVDGGQGPWFSLEVTPEWAPWAFAKGDPGKVIAALDHATSYFEELGMAKRTKKAPVRKATT